jgi:ribosomal protein S18 acetylase RimI-like enzyme
MDQHSIILRPANPTLEEGLVYAHYLGGAGEAFFRTMLGRRALEIVAKASTDPDGNYSYRNVISAEQDGRIAGMALGFPALQMRTVQLPTRPMLQVLKTIADGDFYLLSIAIDEGLRGQGAGSALMDAIENRARASGSTRLALDVAAKN